MESHRKLELSKETLRCLTSDLPVERLMDVRGGENHSINTCLDCITTIFRATLVDPDCYQTR
ncbi:MAG TPA: hypothetical protein VHI71_07630 [Actinomycetota bacterium]|nr:hypothetical protein [Actinomycetota bacterium]